MMDTGVYEVVTGYPAKAVRKQTDPNIRRDFFVRVALPVAALATLIWLLVGCGHASSIPEGVDLCRAGMVTINVETTRIMQRHDAAIAKAIDRCRQQLGPRSTEDARGICMADQGMSLVTLELREKAMVAIGAAYDAIAKALETIDAHAETLKHADMAAEAVLEGSP